MKIRNHDEKALLQAEVLKDNIILCLQQVVTNLERDVEERQLWLENPNPTPPTITRKLGKRQIASLLVIEEKLSKKNRGKTLTSATKSLINAATSQVYTEMERLEDELTTDYREDLKENALYVGLTDAEMQQVEEEFQERLRKEISRLQRQLDKTVEDIIASQPISKVKVVEIKQTTCPEIVAVKKQETNKYEILAQELQTYEKEEKEAFEEQIPACVENGYSDKDIEDSRKDLDKQIKKEKTRRIAEFNKVANMNVRLAEAQIISQSCQDKATFDNESLRVMLELYKRTIEKTIVFPYARFDWDKVVLIIDESFVASKGNWKEFVTLATEAWANCGKKDLRRQMDTRMRLYALLLSNNYFDNADTGISEKDCTITRLGNERDDLIRRVNILDEHVSKKLSEYKLKNQETKKKSLKEANKKKTVVYTTDSYNLPPQDNFGARFEMALKQETEIQIQNTRKMRLRESLLQNEMDKFYDKYSK